MCAGAVPTSLPFFSVYTIHRECTLQYVLLCDPPSCRPHSNESYSAVKAKHTIKTQSPSFSLTCMKLLKGARLSIIGKFPISGSASGPGGKERPLGFLIHLINTNTAKTKTSTKKLESSIPLIQNVTFSSVFFFTSVFASGFKGFYMHSGSRTRRRGQVQAGMGQR